MAHVLSVDDTSAAVAPIRAYLRARGHSVDVASDGDEGLRLSRMYAYDVVIANLQMPGRDGVQLLEELSVRPTGLPVRVLQTLSGDRFMSKEETRSTADFAISTGASGWTGGRGPSFYAQVVDQAIELAEKRVLGRAYTSGTPRKGDRAWPASQELVAPSRAACPSATAEREAVQARLLAKLEKKIAPPGEVVWLPGPLDASRYILGAGSSAAIVGGTWGARRCRPARYEVAGGSRDLLLDAPGEGAIPSWTSLERSSLRERLSTGHGGAVPLVEILLALSHRGIGYTTAYTARDEGHWWHGTVPRPRAGEPTLGPQQIWWWLLDDGTIVIGDRPVSLGLGPDGLAHSTTGPAIEYADGLMIFALHGTSGPGGLRSEPGADSIGTSSAECGDADLSRAAARAVWRVAIPNRGRRQARRHGHRSRRRPRPERPALHAGAVADEDGRRFLVSSDGSTPRVHRMRVPRSCQTCREACVALSGRPDVKTIVEA